MWSDDELSHINFLVSYLKTKVRLAKENNQKGKLLKFLEHELAENENMLLQMEVQKGFHKALSRHPKATREKVLGILTKVGKT